MIIDAFYEPCFRHFHIPGIIIFMSSHIICNPCGFYMQCELICETSGKQLPEKRITQPLGKRSFVAAYGGSILRSSSSLKEIKEKNIKFSFLAKYLWQPVEYREVTSGLPERSLAEPVLLEVIQEGQLCYGVKHTLAWKASDGISWVYTQETS